MKLDQLLLIVSLGLVLVCKDANCAEVMASDPVAERMFSPDLILHNGEAIGLSDEKRQEIQSRIKKAQERFQEMEKSVRKEQEAMVVLLDREKVDEAAVLKQLDSVIAREREIRREQFALMVSLRNLLTPEQQAQLKILRKTYKPQAIESRLKDKLEMVEAGVQELAGKGLDASSVVEKMQRFSELMQVGKVKEAEALLDRALKELDAK